MYRITVFLFLYFAFISTGSAAAWVKVNENSTSKLLVDKQSILQKDQLTRVWVKIEFKTPQKSIDSPDKEYDLSKLLWYFDCQEQKSATSQVFQYMNSQLVHSAGIDVKDALFIEPVPETDLDLAMRHVCKVSKASKPTTQQQTQTKPAPSPEEKTGAAAKPSETKPPAENATAAETKPGEAKSSESKPAALPNDKKADPVKAADEKKTSAKNTAKDNNTDNGKNVSWSYEGKDGPDNWGELDPAFISCEIGSNQSPINIEGTIKAGLKPLKGLQKFTIKDIMNDGRGVIASFKEGNMLLLDDVSFKMKQVHFHTPSEHTFQGKSFPLEAHFLHVDPKGNITKVGVMFNEGKANPGLEKILAQIPTETGKAVPLKTRVSASELFPEKRDYYRYGGSLTAPPCTEGIRWVLMKTPLTASQQQIEAFKKAIPKPNNRPLQPSNGRILIE